MPQGPRALPWARGVLPLRGGVPSERGGSEEGALGAHQQRTEGSCVVPRGLPLRSAGAKKKKKFWKIRSPGPRAVPWARWNMPLRGALPGNSGQAGRPAGRKGAKRKKPDGCQAFSYGWAATYFPTFHCSIIGTAGLNFSVRNGKRCAPASQPPLDSFRVHDGEGKGTEN